MQATNEWAKVEFVFKLTNAGRMLKIRFANTVMAGGTSCSISKDTPTYIEKEIFIKLTPNCYSYEHKTQSCGKEKQSICAFCA